MRDKIICLIGASGSGKTTIAKELEKEGYNIIHSYTTREPREPNEWGHIFIDDRDVIEHHYKMIAHKELYEYVYFATREQYKNKGSSIYVVDPEGARQVKENVDDAEVITIYLMVDEFDRKWRMIGQGRGEYAVLERLLKDREVFKTCKCDYVVDANGELEDVLENIWDIIK